MTPNIVMVCVDQWRGDCLGSHGNTQVHTPFLDGFSDQGLDFTQAYSAAPTCVPARMSLLTGLSADTHRRVGYEDGVPFDVDQTLPQVLSDVGYQTQAVGKLHYFPDRARVGFDEVILHNGYLHSTRLGRPDPRFYDDYLPWLQQQGRYGEDLLDDGLDCNAYVARPWGHEEYLHPTNWVTSEAINWLYRRDPTRPFFLYVSYHRPHPPYDAPQWAWDIFDDVELDEFPSGDWQDYFDQWRKNYDPTALVTSPPRLLTKRAMQGYFASMAHIDQQFSRLRQALFEFGLDKNTMIVFTSDHGEMMGQHGLWRKGLPYEGSARVPLIIAGPGIPAGQSDNLVELRDIMPTILDAVGIPIPDTVEGKSVLNPDDSTPRPALHGEHVLLGQSIQWVRFGDFKYVWFSDDGHEQLFNLADDPNELVDLAGDPQFEEACNEGRDWLVKYLRGREEGFVEQIDSDSAPVLKTGRQVNPVLSQPHQLPRELL